MKLTPSLPALTTISQTANQASNNLEHNWKNHRVEILTGLAVVAGGIALAATGGTVGIPAAAKIIAGLGLALGSGIFTGTIAFSTKSLPHNQATQLILPPKLDEASPALKDEDNNIDLDAPNIAQFAESFFSKRDEDDVPLPTALPFHPEEGTVEDDAPDQTIPDREEISGTSSRTIIPYDPSQESLAAAERLPWYFSILANEIDVQAALQKAQTTVQAERPSTEKCQQRLVAKHQIDQMERDFLQQKAAKKMTPPEEEPIVKPEPSSLRMEPKTAMIAISVMAAGSLAYNAYQSGSIGATAELVSTAASSALNYAAEYIESCRGQPEQGFLASWLGAPTPAPFFTM